MPTIVVLVKQVPDTNAKIVVQGDRVDLSSVKMVMSPYDEFAIETAIRHKEATDGTVTALTVGGPVSEKILKDAKVSTESHPRFVRALDFHSGPEKVKALESLLDI